MNNDAGEADGAFMIDYLLEIVYDPNDAALDELVQGRLYMTASTGMTVTDAGPETVLCAYFDTGEARAAAAEMFADLDVELRQLERERVDWLDLYEQSLEPLFIGRRFVVAPDARLIPAGSDRMSIVVPQELAFGTGSHETTWLCIELLEELVGQAGASRQRGLDVGSGSGILAMAMLRLGAEKAIAFDNDPDAYGPLRDNRIRNRVREESMPLFIGGTEALRGGEFDIVTMNIIPEVIIPLLPQVVVRVANGGTLLLSGILNERRDDVVAACREHGFEVTLERSRGEWWAGAFTSS